MNNIKEINKLNDEEFKDIRIITTDDNKILFCGSDIAIALGYKKPANAITTHCKGATLLEGNDNLGRKQQLNFITEGDVCMLITKSKVLDYDCKNNFKKWLIDEKLISDKFVIETRFETEFFNKLDTILNVLGYNLEFQKSVFNGKYKIDGYIPQLKIAIEYDEEQHKYQIKNDKKRQQAISEELNCKFIRCNYKNTDEYNIGLVLKYIFDNK